MFSICKTLLSANYISVLPKQLIWISQKPEWKQKLTFKNALTFIGLLQGNHTLFLTIHSESCPVSVCGDIEDGVSGGRAAWTFPLLMYIWRVGRCSARRSLADCLETHPSDCGDKKLAWQVVCCVLSVQSAVQPCSLSPSTGVTGAYGLPPAEELQVFVMPRCCPPQCGYGELLGQLLELEREVRNLTEYATGAQSWRAEAEGEVRAFLGSGRLRQVGAVDTLGMRSWRASRWKERGVNVLQRPVWVQAARSARLVGAGRPGWLLGQTRSTGGAVGVKVTRCLH